MAEFIIEREDGKEKITEERARHLINGCYKGEAVKEMLDSLKRGSVPAIRVISGFLTCPAR